MLLLLGGEREREREMIEMKSVKENISQSHPQSKTINNKRRRKLMRSFHFENQYTRMKEREREREREIEIER
jgi:hypothetical protein